MRREGADMLHAQLLQSAPHLGEMVPVDLAGFRGAEIMRAPIGVEAHRQPVLRKDLLQRPEGRGRAFLLDQERRIDRPRRVIERDNEVERRLALEPGMPRAVLVQHHPRQRSPLTLPSVRAFPRRLPDDAFPLQMQLQPGVAPAKAVVLHQMLVEVLDREALVTLAIKRLHLLRPIDRNPLARRLAEPPVDKPGLALLVVAVRPSPERPLAHSQKLGGFTLVELRRFPPVQNIQKHRHAHPLKGFRPAHPAPPKRGQTYRTDRALPKPDISSATDNSSAFPCVNRKSRL
jgi:hypothetical protein